MASNLKFFLFAVVLAGISLDGAKARPILASISNLSARLKLDEESPNCWDSLFQLQACIREMFYSSSTALSTVGEHCWPNMIGTLGFTTEESQILDDYCDIADDFTTPSPSTPYVVPVKVVPKKPKFLD
ncbi:PROTEIN putative EXPRESSED-RELATED [Salix purpurea]|uniref:PROTEIN putative EXPRESSED-RELATED n=1 Tax=Salix purpurea TaxID=77065 RepID=A0A9Q0QI21_SALPP|nr:PROTEIN putative EXPRESSED-RELATED [Salix purpurea]